jgi:hypothetical protein
MSALARKSLSMEAAKLEFADKSAHSVSEDEPLATKDTVFVLRASDRHNGDLFYARVSSPAASKGGRADSPVDERALCRSFLSRSSSCPVSSAQYSTAKTP